MNQSLSLREASVQEIQLELIRRTKFNAFNGEQIYASMLKHRELWTAVLLDRPGVSAPYGSALLLIDGLIKLRDLPDNIWNADTLYILTPSPETARELAQRIADGDLGGEIMVYEDSEETAPALGAIRHEYGLLTVWWD
ncbi:MAG: hypothetical protein L0241_27425 [Planctomycetia bacterium]|nr:hypothetical protein [Planctomycetia bacterium]